MKNCETCGGPNLTQQECYWLIEADGTYYDGHFTDSRGFTRKIDDAVRFARYQDAETVKHWLLQEHSFALRTTQHCWVDGEPANRRFPILE